MASGVARGIAYLHSQQPPVLHRDLKPDNVLVDNGYGAKISDFGVSREADLEKTMEVAGTPLYMAPELLRRENYDEKVDVWSFACVLECLWTHEQVYAGEMEQVTSSVRRVEEETLRPSATAGCFLAPLIDACSKFGPAERWAMHQAVEFLRVPSLLHDVALLPPGPPSSWGQGWQAWGAMRAAATGGGSSSADGERGCGRGPLEQAAHRTGGGAATEIECAPASSSSSQGAAETKTLRSKIRRSGSDLHGWDHGVEHLKEASGKVFGRRDSAEKHDTLQAQRAASRARRSQSAGLTALRFASRMSPAKRLPNPKKSEERDALEVTV